MLLNLLMDYAFKALHSLIPRRVKIVTSVMLPLLLMLRNPRVFSVKIGSYSVLLPSITLKHSFSEGSTKLPLKILPLKLKLIFRQMESEFLCSVMVTLTPSSLLLRLCWSSLEVLELTHIFPSSAHMSLNTWKKPILHS